MKNFAARELAIIGSIDGALARESNPELVVLLDAIKEGHQAAYSQVAALARIEHRPMDRPWPIASTVMQLEGWIARSVGAGFHLDVLRNLEHQFERAYFEARDESRGTRRDVLDHLARRASQRMHVLAKRGPRTCMRCLLDRRGPKPALDREHPHIYICAACHGEVRASFSPDLAAQLDSWPARLRDARIIERALGRSSKQRARDEVHTVLAGQAPIVHTEQPSRAETPIERSRPVEGLATKLVIPPTDDADEAAYTARLFDYRSIRARW
jgi:hypothetical protein